MNRLTVASLMAAIGVIAAGLAALRHPSATAASAICTVTILVLLLAALGAVVRPPPAAGWRGAALFGGAYYLLAFHFPPNPLAVTLPTGALINSVVLTLHPEAVKPARPALERPEDPVWQNGVPGWSYVPGDPSAHKPVQFFPLSAEDARAYNAYQVAEENYSIRTPAISEMMGQSYAIGHSYLTLLFALLGSIVGRVLAGGGQSVTRPTTDDSKT
jgi:hypothetical protein